MLTTSHPQQTLLVQPLLDQAANAHFNDVRNTSVGRQQMLLERHMVRSFIMALYTQKATQHV